MVHTFTLVLSVDGILCFMV